ncbi:S1 family peptidase [Achromobacter xylosoxidans]|nr:serine protease [Achromobacter xylosoxidans]
MSNYESPPPLHNLPWNQGTLPAEYGNSLLVIMATDLEGRPHAVGTAFVINHSDDGRTATCLTAAHVFTEVHRLQTKPARHTPSALAEFLPPPKPIDIDRKLVRAIGTAGGRAEAAIIEGLTYDEDRDVALFDVKLQDASPDGFFCSRFEVTGELPDVGEMVCVLSFAGLAMEQKEDYGAQGYMATLSKSLMFRVGRVLQHFPVGQRLCKGPCIETSIPVFSGMSGGPLMRYSTEGPMLISALVSFDPDLDCEDKNNRDIEGRSVFAALPVSVSEGAEGRKFVEILMPEDKGVGTMKSPDQGGPGLQDR